MAGIPREVLRWLLSLNINLHHRKLKWHVSNGVLAAEIIHNYQPKVVDLGKFIDGQSIEVRLRNWKLIQQVFHKLNIFIPPEVIEGVVHNKSNAGLIFLTLLYELLTQKKLVDDVTFDPTDLEYQFSLPVYARSCLAKFIKDNVASSELKTEPDLFCNQKKVQSLALAYKNMKLTERMAEPRRYRVFRPLASHCRRSESSELRNIVHNEKADIMSANVLHEETSMNDTVLTIQPKQQAVFE
ncbi:unnamed protein product [Heterobilharzia americana]|nr:unnamed protein product [Heterobilharzia americana]